MGWNRFRTYALVAAVALVSTLVVVPAFGSDHVEVVDAVEFTSVDGTAKFLYGDLKQVLTTDKNGCQIKEPAGAVLSLAGDGGPPGLHSLGIGVRTSGKNANGTPCSQIDVNETLTIQPGSSLTGKMFSKVRLDLEVTKDAIVVLTLSDGGVNPEEFRLRTGSNAIEADTTTAPFKVFSDGENRNGDCAASTSSGPNSHANDNCIWTVEPGFDFDTIQLTIDPASPDGTVSLEGGSDTGPENTTLFFVAPDRLNCDEEKLFEGEGEPTYKVLPKNGLDGCEKVYTYEASSGTDGDQFVKLITSGSGPIVLLEKLEFLPQAASAGSSSQIGRELYYDDVLGVDTEKLAQFCLLDPRVGAGTDSPSFDLADPYFSAEGAPLVLPEGETTCIINAEFLTTGTDLNGNPLVESTFWLYNLDDGVRTFK